MFPWDFGLIEALKYVLQLNIFAEEPPEEQRVTPYLIFEMKKISPSVNNTARADLQITIVDKEEISLATYDFIKMIEKATRQELTLKQGEFTIGSAKIKLDKVATRRNSIILNLVALLKLKAIYEDENEAQDD
ncbi:MAG: hypothetical protein IJA14_01530 [Alphaproteobacteria bacterium]|nr:hypothetical protein [Alphaproteobacteria bacterium]